MKKQSRILMTDDMSKYLKMLRLCQPLCHRCYVDLIDKSREVLKTLITFNLNDVWSSKNITTIGSCYTWQDHATQSMLDYFLALLNRIAIRRGYAIPNFCVVHLRRRRGRQCRQRCKLCFKRYLL